MTNSSTKIKIFILDDHQMLIDGIKALIKNDKTYEVIGEETSGVKALVKLGELNPDIVITDINMPEMSGMEFTKQVKLLYPEIKILALSMFSDRGNISEMLDSGVNGYILKNTGKQELINALDKITEGQYFFSDEISVEMMKAFHDKQQKKLASTSEEEASLTDREIEIVKLIGQEHSNSKIADLLCISERTVESHRKNIFRKTKTKTVIGLIKYVIERKII